jgi:hypothetical protein
MPTYVLEYHIKRCNHFIYYYYYYYHSGSKWIFHIQGTFYTFRFTARLNISVFPCHVMVLWWSIFMYYFVFPNRCTGSSQWDWGNNISIIHSVIHDLGWTLYNIYIIYKRSQGHLRSKKAHSHVQTDMEQHVCMSSQIDLSPMPSEGNASVALWKNNMIPLPFWVVCFEIRAYCVWRYYCSKSL